MPWENKSGGGGGPWGGGGNSGGGGGEAGQGGAGGEAGDQQTQEGATAVTQNEGIKDKRRHRHTDELLPALPD